MPSRAEPSRVLWLLTALAGVGFGLVALALGMDANWDLRNYHYYNGWRLLNGLVDRDVLAAQIASFYNPLLDVPYAWAVDKVPATVIGFALGALHGLNFGLLFAISRHVLTVRYRDTTAALVALAGVTGAGALSELGTVFYDNVVSLGALASVLLVVAHWDALAEEPPGPALKRALLAGVPAGLAFGLKQPSVILCVGLCLAFLIAPMEPVRRLWLAFWFGVGVLVGFVITGGSWALHLWRSTGNPVFPYFNQLFGSSWAVAASYRDPTFLPSSLWDAVTLGFRYPFEPLLVGESGNVDFRLFALLALLPVAMLARRRTDPLLRPGPAGWLLAACLLAYGLWLYLFGIYRYIITLEMLAPLLVMGLIGALPLPRRARMALAVVLLVAVAALSEPGDWLRVPWRQRAVEAALPPIDPAGLVVMTGHEPMSFLVPLFPKTMRFIRVDSTFTLPPEHNTPFRQVFRRAIATAGGPIYALHTVSDTPELDGKLAPYGVSVVPDSCVVFTSSIGDGNDPYRLCLTRRAATK
ncbi:MAG: hypothetical protein H7Z12_14860 [Rhodospirillaceae bacterium]|nr:hypothetical protein [Rhodospirillales bacterium]